MQYRLVSASDVELLPQILQKLKSKYVGHSNLQKNFYRSLPDNKEWAFAIATQGGDIKIVYQLIRELKFTRGMQPVYHTQQLLVEVGEDELVAFEKWMVTNLVGYKILGLNVSSKKVFEPHQFYMEAKKRPNL